MPKVSLKFRVINSYSKHGRIYARKKKTKLTNQKKKQQPKQQQKWTTNSKKRRKNILKYKLQQNGVFSRVEKKGWFHNRG